MKFQKGGFAVLLVIAVCLLPFSVPGHGSGQVTADKELLDKLVSATSVPDEAKKSLAVQIGADFKAMQELFKKQNSCCLAKLLGKRGASLTTPGFEKISGAASAGFWKSVCKPGAELRLVPVYIHASPVKEPQPVPFCDVIDQGITIDEWMKNPGYYDAVAIVVFEFHIIEHEQGGISSNSTGEASATYLHKNGCPWL